MARRELIVLFFWSWYKRSLVANLQFSFSHVNAPVRCKSYSFCKRKFRHFREPTDKMQDKNRRSSFEWRWASNGYMRIFLDKYLLTSIRASKFAIWPHRLLHVCWLIFWKCTKYLLYESRLTMKHHLWCMSFSQRKMIYYSFKSRGSFFITSKRLPHLEEVCDMWKMRHTPV